ncbi:MAG: hypothetical protein F4X64_14845 [Chloroflexi bacterium]|nr:hypothetical protein [Chloroflexota bacterium]
MALLLDGGQAGEGDSRKTLVRIKHERIVLAIAIRLLPNNGVVNKDQAGSGSLMPVLVNAQ